MKYISFIFTTSWCLAFVLILHSLCKQYLTLSLLAIWRSLVACHTSTVRIYCLVFQPNFFTSYILTVGTAQAHSWWLLASFVVNFLMRHIQLTFNRPSPSKVLFILGHIQTVLLVLKVIFWNHLNLVLQSCVMTSNYLTSLSFIH